MKNIIILFLMFASIVFAEWSYSIHHNDKGKLLATFDLEGLKEIIEQKLGNSDWYKHKLND